MGGETKEHKLLKELAVIWLRGYGCHQIATEVELHPVWLQGTNEQRVTYHKWKHVADVVGIRDRYSPTPAELPAHKRRYLEAVAVEVKVSRSDFKNGFVSSGCDRIYLFTLPNMLDLNDIPKHVGLMELDPDNFTVLGWAQRIPPTPTVHGIVMKRKAKRLIQDKDVAERTLKHIQEFRATPSLIAVLLGKYLKSENALAIMQPKRSVVATDLTSPTMS